MVGAPGRPADRPSKLGRQTPHRPPRIDGKEGPGRRARPAGHQTRAVHLTRRPGLMATRQTNYSQRTFPITSGPNTPPPSPTRPRIDGRRDLVGAPGRLADRPSKLGRTLTGRPGIDGNAPDKPPTTDIPHHIWAKPHPHTPPRPSINGDPPLPVDDHLVVAACAGRSSGTRPGSPGSPSSSTRSARGRPDDHGQQPGHQQQPQPIAEPEQCVAGRAGARHPCNVRTAVSRMVAQPPAVVRPAATSTGSDHSRYHGCTTGPSTTTVSMARPAPRTADRPVA